MAKDEKPKIVLQRTYNVPLRKEFLKVPKYKRSKKAVYGLRRFLKRHMKSDQVKIGKHLNELIWSKGIKNPPHHVQIDCVKDDTGVVHAELVGKPVYVEEPVLKSKKAKAEKKADVKEDKAEAKAEKKTEADKAEKDEKVEAKPDKKKAKAGEEKAENIVEETELEVKEEKPKKEAKPAKEPAAKVKSEKKADKPKKPAKQEKLKTDKPAEKAE